MSTVTPDDIPTSVMAHVFSAPWIGDPKTAAIKLSENEARAQLAHYWPAIRAQFAQQLLDQNPDRDADFSAGVDWAVDLIRNS